MKSLRKIKCSHKKPKVPKKSKGRKAFMLESNENWKNERIWTWRVLHSVKCHDQQLPKILNMFLICGDHNCYGLNCVPKNSYAGALTLNGTIFGERAFKDLSFNESYGRSLLWYDWCPNEEIQRCPGYRNTEKRPCEDTGEGGHLPGKEETSG